MGKDLFVGSVPVVVVFEFCHLTQGQAEKLELFYEAQPPEIVVGIDSPSALDPFDRVEETDFFIVTYCAGAESE
jgi:hypothetical protein